ncbi:MAG: DUF4011 domain-containing anti-phage protein Hhe [Rhodocyclaceae bacterium]
MNQPSLETRDIQDTPREPPSSSKALQALENLRMRLLDLTARNRLINFRHTRTSSLRVIDELPDQLAEALLAENELRFEAIPEPTEAQLVAAGYLEPDPEGGEPKRLRNDPSAEEWARHLGFATDYALPLPPAASASGDPTQPDPDDAAESAATRLPARHTDHAIQTLLYPHELEAQLKSLSQTAESAIQEMGANILYLAFGFLEWFESSSSDAARLAPLFLVPVHLQRGRLNPRTRTYEYTLSHSGEDILPNLSLREKLRADFGMALPDLDENTAPEAYFDEVRALIETTQPRWRVRRFASLVLLNFSKLLMYLDLDPARWPEHARLVDHPVVSGFLSGYEDTEAGSQASGSGFGEEHPIDEIDTIHIDYPLIDDADSSQHSALIDAVNGRNLVIEGPPGTGKSQTITNLIAAAIAQGKKVLFVAEKLAALEVVRSRLDRAGLGEFCLELHSHKTQKRKVLDEVEERLRKHGHYRPPEQIAADIARYEELKNALKRHAERINQPWKNTGQTPHQILTAATRYRLAPGLNPPGQSGPINPETLHPEGHDGSSWDADTQRRHADERVAYRSVHQALIQQLGADASLDQHPWHGVRNGELQLFDLERVRAGLDHWQTALTQLQEQHAAIAGRLACPPATLGETLTELDALAAELDAIPPLRGDELLAQLPVLHGDVLEKCRRYLELFEDLQQRHATLAAQIGANALRELERTDALDPLRQGAEALRQRVTPDTTLGALAEALRRLGTIEQTLTGLDETWRGVQSALGETAARHLQPSRSGITELRTLVELVASLPPACWAHRAPLFDNDELDTLLPRLRSELEQLRPQHAQLARCFALTERPPEDELRQLSGTLAAGGLLRWFKGDWRNARKRLLGLAANGGIRFAELLGQLDAFADYAGKRQRFDADPALRAALGAHFRGLDTDLDTLETLRTWYKRIRLHYGIGFGQKVALGDALIGLSASIVPALRSLAERGLPAQLEALCADLVAARETFAPTTDSTGSTGFADDHAPLIGDHGLLAATRTAVQHAIDACGALAHQDTLTVAGLLTHIEQFAQLRQREDLWRKADFDRRLFNGQLRLQPGTNADNHAGLSRLRNTLTLATAIEHGLRTPALLAGIRTQPTPETFAALAELGAALRTALSAHREARDAFVALVDLDLPAWSAATGDHVAALLARNRLALDQGETLQNWLDYVRVRDRMRALGLGRLVDAIESRALAIEQLEPAALTGIHDLLAREILREDAELARFSGHAQQALQERFREYDNRLKRLQCEQIAWKVDQTEIPAGQRGARVSERTERFLLEHECGKKTRHLPIRQLLQRAGGALVALKPCFMMGPMSVAQYLAPGQIAFDLIVMDEASQIKPEDALGAIARGGQLVVVGDPKQLPPTSFFDRMQDDGDGDSDLTGIEESESILDATLPIFPARRLRWHYRSQHESLIAFSNQSFYDGDLVLFPSPHKHDEHFGIQYSRVQGGCFINRRNLEEARIIAEAVREHFAHRADETLGVVAMSAEQRLHIERAIDDLARDDALFRERLERDANHPEALFVKNLENVQGDERDVIYISMTYGPQEPGGRVLQRFGPINSDVGWRRLNVLFTRSRKRMHIFSSMGSDDIVVGASSKRGVQALRAFLAYCETGILHHTQHATGRAPDSDFEIAVIEALRREGFDCVPQVGVAGFFIDIAVIDPGRPGRYLMGIECDGATYHSAKSVRDRDRLRQAVLERLGWRIRRIWSTDWFKNPRGELAPIVRELHSFKTPDPEPPEEAKSNSALSP